MKYLAKWLKFYFQVITQFLCSSNIKLEFMAVGKFAHQKPFAKLFNYHHFKLENWQTKSFGIGRPHDSAAEVEKL